MTSNASRAGLLLAAAALLAVALGVTYWGSVASDRDATATPVPAESGATTAAPERTRLDGAPESDHVAPTVPEADARTVAATGADALQAASDPKPESATAGTLVLRGFVRDDRGNPCDRFRIRVRPPVVGGRRVERPGKPIRGDFEARDGAYELGGLTTGTWEVRAERDRLASLFHTVELVHAVTTLDLVLPRAAGIAGSVVDPSGRPVPDATVDLHRDSVERCAFDGQAPGRIVCDGEGRFELGELAPCPLLLEACAEGFSTSPRERVELAPGEGRRDLRLTLRLGGRITGLALDARGNPDAGRRVSVTGPVRPCGAKPGPLTTDESGRFEVGGLAPGTIWVHRYSTEAEQQAGLASSEKLRELQLLRAATNLTLAEGETRHVVLGGDLSPGMRIWGVVAGAGDCGRPMFVNAYPVEQKTTFKRLFAAVDEAGRYEIVLDEGGAYTLSVDTTGGTLLRRDAVLSDEPAQRIDFELGAASARGRVLGMDGAPLANVNVSPHRQEATNEGRHAGGDRRRVTTTGADGTFALDCLLAGTYELVARPKDERPVGQGGSSEARLEGVVLEPGARIEGLEIRFARAATLEIAITDLPVPTTAIRILAVDERGTAVALHDEGTRGDVLLRGARPGRLFLRAHLGELASAWTGPIEALSARTIRVELAPVRGAVLTVEVSGTVPSSGVQLTVLDEGRRLLSHARCPAPERGAAGSAGTPSVKLAALPRGRHVLRAEDGRGWRNDLPIEIDSDQPRTVQVRLPD